MHIVLSQWLAQIKGSTGWISIVFSHIAGMLHEKDIQQHSVSPSASALKSEVRVLRLRQEQLPLPRYATAHFAPL